jgi:hypothetical protein
MEREGVERNGERRKGESERHCLWVRGMALDELRFVEVLSEFEFCVDIGFEFAENFGSAKSRPKLRFHMRKDIVLSPIKQAPSERVRGGPRRLQGGRTLSANDHGAQVLQNHCRPHRIAHQRNRKQQSGQCVLERPDRERAGRPLPSGRSDAMSAAD